MIGLVVIPLVAMMISDFRSREVALLWLILFGAIQTGMGIFIHGIREAMLQVACNFMMLCVLGLFLIIWILIRRGGKGCRLQGYMGSGDVLFLCALSPVFRLDEFIRFLIIAFTVSLVLWGIYVALSRQRVTVPLVTTVGLCYLALLIWKIIA